jgi:hypothetical protein
MEGDSRNPIRLAGALVTGGEKKRKINSRTIYYI